MYQITCDEYILYDVRDDGYMLYNPRLHLNVNSAGTLTFIIYGNHPHFNGLKKLRSQVVVKKDNKTIWKGRIVNDKKNFYGDRAISCEGKLAFFNDSIMRSFEFSGSPEELFTMVIENHNSQVKEFQKFKIGNVTVKDANNYIVRSSESNLSTLEVLKTRLFESSSGGYLNIRYEKDGDYIDWLSDFRAVSKQDIRFGENLLDLMQETNAEETYTAMIPQGYKDETGKRVDIAGVNEGKDYIINEEMAYLYGVIYAPETVSTWEDVKEPENLLKKARDYLNNTGVKLKETIELKAFDLNLTDKEVESFNHCEYIPVISEPHGINKMYLLREMDIPFDEPQNTTITMGESRLTLSDLELGGASAGSAGNEMILQKVGELEKSIPANMSDLTNDTNYQTQDDVVKLIEEGISGLETLSPTVEVKADGEEEYVLTIADKNGIFDTPNLKGKNGVPGPSGADGLAATIEIGKVDTGTAGSIAVVRNVGTKNAAILDFIIPRGDKGDKGEPGTGGGGGDTMFGFEIREDGHLWVCSEGEDASNFYINEQGHLIYRIGGTTV